MCLLFRAACAAFFTVEALSCFGQDNFRVSEDAARIEIAAAHYRIEIVKKGFCYGFSRSDGTVIAAAARDYGLEFGGGRSLDTRLLSENAGRIELDVSNDRGQHATVAIEPRAHDVRFAITPSTANRILARIGGISPAFGLGDHAAYGRKGTDVTGFSEEHFRSGQRRLVSNFVISPGRGIAVVNMEKEMKIVRVTDEETAQGVDSAARMPALYYFIGAPREIYSAYLQARNREGYTVCRPKYELFGVGWEAFGALGWNTNEKTVTQNVDQYLNLGYPLEWMIVGSGFWPNENPALCATTSFGLWDKTRYPEPKRFIGHFKREGLKFMLGLRIAFIKDGPYSSEGVAKGYFLKENGMAAAWKIAFPKRPAYLLDGSNPDAVKWYAGLCQKWLDYGVDGFKEDLFGYRASNIQDGNIDAVNQALMDKGVFIMGRNGYLGSACDIHRIDDFNFDQNQDRGPMNVLSFAYSGFPYAYPDILGGTFGEGRKMPPLDSPVMQTYIMRAAQFDAVNPAMAVGMGPWNFGSAQVSKVALAMAQLHGRLHPYIYSAAMDAYESGFPWTLAPLPLVFPDDPNVYGRENTTTRGYEWMLGPSLLATPLYGNDYATAATRDVYLPAGKWMDYDTGETYTGPKLLERFPIPVEKTPLFVGGKGVLVLRDGKKHAFDAVVYPIAAGGSIYRFTDRDGTTHSTIVNDNVGWETRALRVNDVTRGVKVAFTRDVRSGAIHFPLIPGHDYRLTGG